MANRLEKSAVAKKPQLEKSAIGKIPDSGETSTRRGDGIDNRRHCEGITMNGQTVKIVIPRFWLIAMLGLSISPAINAATAKDVKSARPDNGAIAYHRASGVFGFAVDRRNVREAKTEALKQCNNSECEVVLTLKNGCGALAAFQKTYFVSRGATRAEAEAKSRRQCGPKCEVVVWACTK